VYDRGNSEYLRREKNDGEIQMWERVERKHVLDGRRREGAECPETILQYKQNLCLSFRV
jgi:hypothetical protein